MIDRMFSLVVTIFGNSRVRLFAKNQLFGENQFALASFSQAVQLAFVFDPYFVAATGQVFKPHNFQSVRSVIGMLLAGRRSHHPRLNLGGFWHLKLWHLSFCHGGR